MFIVSLIEGKTTFFMKSRNSKYNNFKNNDN